MTDATDTTDGEKNADLDAIIPGAADAHASARRAALQGCVARMKAMNLKGKARDDAAGHFLAGAVAALGGLGFLAPFGNLADPESYTDVLEALAEA